MAAPIGNKFWEARSSHGRAPIFGSPEELWDCCLEYFDWIEANPLYGAQAFAYQGNVKIENMPKMRAMTVASLCIFLDISVKTWAEYRERQDFTPITTRVDEIIRTQKFQGAAADLLNPNIIARDLGLADRNEHTGRDGGPIAVADVTEQEAARRIAFTLAKATQATTD